MTIARSKLTGQGQISVPAEVRKRLGIGPGSILEWDEGAADSVVVKRATRFSSEEIHREIFDKKPDRKQISDFKEGIRERMKKRYAKR